MNTTEIQITIRTPGHQNPNQFELPLSTLTTICMHCKVVLATVPHPQEAVSHGICPACREHHRALAAQAAKRWSKLKKNIKTALADRSKER